MEWTSTKKVCKKEFRGIEKSLQFLSPIKSSKQIADLALEVIPLALGVDPNYKRSKGR